MRNVEFLDTLGNTIISIVTFPFILFFFFASWIVSFIENYNTNFNYYVQYVGFFGCVFEGFVGIIFYSDRGYQYNYCNNMLLIAYPAD